MPPTKSQRKRPAKPNKPKPGNEDGRSHELVLRIGGSHAGVPVTPRSADPGYILPFVAAYLEALHVVADDDDEPLAVQGLALREGSVEVEAEVERDELGHIVGGRVLEVAIVAEGNALGAWQQWFKENSGDWDEARVEGILGRNRD